MATSADEAVKDLPDKTVVNREVVAFDEGHAFTVLRMDERHRFLRRSRHVDTAALRREELTRACICGQP